MPPFRELDTEAVTRARVYVDWLEAACNEAEDLRVPLQVGLIEPGHIAGELGEVLLGRLAGRAAATDIALLKSVGLAAEDLAAQYVYERAPGAGIGAPVELAATRGSADT